MKASVPASPSAAASTSAAAGETSADDDGGDQRAEREQQLDGHGVERERGGDEVVAVRQQPGHSVRMAEPTLDSVIPPAKPMHGEHGRRRADLGQADERARPRRRGRSRRGASTRAGPAGR